jgi:Zn-dependent M28 family amino/carboxypeptidase
MKAANKVATGLILLGIAAFAGVEISRYYDARAEVLAAAAGFNGERAFEDLRHLVDLGPRPPGSEALQRAREYIAQQLSTAGVETWDDTFVATTPVGDIPMTNLIGVLRGESPTVVTLAGHYDTATIEGVRFVGANDGGSSAAFLLEMARVLSRRNNRFTYWVVFFDGEEALKEWSSSDSLYGSRHLAERLSREGKLNQIKALILVDMVADRHLNILRESNSTAWLSDLVFKTARTLGYARLFSGGTFPVEDDHLPLLARGIPSVDIIDLTPFGSYHHTAQDSSDKCSPESLTVVGRVVLATLVELERMR